MKDPFRQVVAAKLIKIMDAEPFRRILLLLEILHEIAISNGYYYLTNFSFKPYSNEIDFVRMDQVYDFVYNNIHRNLNIGEVAELLSMSISNFCHYFKKRTNKTFTQLVNELRISKAKKLLIATDYSVAEICYQCGYNSVSNFNKQFYNLTKTSPREFKRLFA